MKKALFLILCLLPHLAFAGLEINPITGKMDKTGLNANDAILKNGTSITTAKISFAHGASMTQTSADDGTVLDLIMPLTTTSFGIRMQGYYTDGARADGEWKTTDNSISNLFTFHDGTIWSPTATAKTGWSFGAAPLIYGANNADNLYGFLSSPYSRGSLLTYSGTLTNLYGFSSQPLWASGTLTNMYLFHGSPAGISGGTVNNLYGFYLANITGASNNWAIYTNSGAVHFGDNVDTVGTITSSKTTNLGWTVVSVANQACNTTCTSACVFGHNLTAGVPGPMLACTDATADECLCAGAS